MSSKDRPATQHIKQSSGRSKLKGSDPNKTARLKKVDEQQQKVVSASSTKRGERSTSTTSSDDYREQTIGVCTTSKTIASGSSKTTTSNVIDQSGSAMDRRHSAKTTTTTTSARLAQKPSWSNKQLATGKRRQQLFKEAGRDRSEDTSSSSQEMTTASASSATIPTDVTLTPMKGGNIVFEQETNLDSDLIIEQVASDNTDEDEGTTLLDSPERTKKNSQINSAMAHDLTSQTAPQAGCSHEHDTVLYHDDEEINYDASRHSTPTMKGALKLQPNRRVSTTDDDEYELEEDFNDELSNGAALTMADDDQLTTVHSEDISFVVYPLGSCEFDETQLVSTTSTRAIQKCILRLSNKPTREEAMCWGLGQSQPILMRLLDDHIQFTDIAAQNLMRSLPIPTIKSWAVDDNNNFAFVVEENLGARDDDDQPESSVDYALLNGPVFMCYVFRSLDDDDMSCRVAAKLNQEITRYREQLATRVSKSTRLQHEMSVTDGRQAPPMSHNVEDQTTDLDAEDMDELDQLEAANEMTINVKYIGKVQVPRPMGIDVLNVAIDKCLANASNRSSSADELNSNEYHSNVVSSSPFSNSPLINAKLHVSPSSVIVENMETGSIIVECRIRFLTFMGISRRDIRWCGFIMQNTTNKTFVAHCFECHPTAGHVCDAIQASCSRMYEKMLRGQKTKRQQQEDATSSIMPNGSRIRDTLAKTLSKIKLTPIIRS